MKGSKWALALAALLVAKGAGLLPRGHELEGRQLISALAVDGGEEITVTAVTGVRVSEDEEAEVLAGAGKSLAEACHRLRSSSARQAYLGQTEQLLLGEDAKLGETLEFVLKDRELRLDTLLYIVKGTAGKALETSAEKVATETGGRDPRSRTVGEILPRLAEGECALAPALAPGEGGALEPAGWVALGSDGIAGYFEEDAAQGAALLAGLGIGRVVTLPHGAAEVTATRIWAKDGTLSCVLTGRIAEGEPPEQELADWGERCLRAALDQNWDCWGLDREQGALQPWNWERLKGGPVSALKVKVVGRLVKG